MKLKDKTAITIQVDDWLLEDIRVILNRRGQTLSEFLRRAAEREVNEASERP